VTYNLDDFPASTLAAHGIQVHHFDGYISHSLDVDAPDVCLAVKKQRESLKNPPKSVDEHLAKFAGLSVPHTVIGLKHLQFVVMLYEKMKAAWRSLRNRRAAHGLTRHRFGAAGPFFWPPAGFGPGFGLGLWRPPPFPMVHRPFNGKVKHPE